MNSCSNSSIMAVGAFLSRIISLLVSECGFSTAWQNKRNKNRKLNLEPCQVQQAGVESILRKEMVYQTT